MAVAGRLPGPGPGDAAVTGAEKRKGDARERQAAAAIDDLLGVPARRMLGAGRADDVGDIHGVPLTVIQVADWRDALRAVWEKPIEAETQRANAGAVFAASWIWLPRRGFRVALTPEQWATYARESM